MKDSRFYFCVTLGFIVSLIFIVTANLIDFWDWNETAANSGDGDAVLWQVQTTIFSAGFAVIAIATQLFSEAPTVIGVSRNQILGHIAAKWFVSIGLLANLVMAVGALWFPSTIGTIFLVLFCFLPTLGLLAFSLVRLTKLFGNPYILDAVVQESLTDALVRRMGEASDRYEMWQKELNNIPVKEFSEIRYEKAQTVINVPVPQAGLILKRLKPGKISQVVEALQPQVTEVQKNQAQKFSYFEIVLHLRPGDRTEPEEVLFSVRADRTFNESSQKWIIETLKSSVVFETALSTSPDEEIEREVASLLDAIGISLRSGAIATAERAFELLGKIIHEAWKYKSEHALISWNRQGKRRYWMEMAIYQVERDILLSPKIAAMFVDQAHRRLTFAPFLDESEYLDMCLKSFTNLWKEVITGSREGFELIPGEIISKLQRLILFSDFKQPSDLPERSIWVFVEIIKISLDSYRVDSARLAAHALRDLADHFERDQSKRIAITSGQLVLLSWIEFLRGENDDRATNDPELCDLLIPKVSREEIMKADPSRLREDTLFSRWSWWEMKINVLPQLHSVRLPTYIDEILIKTLAVTSGYLPKVESQSLASRYRRLLDIFTSRREPLTTPEKELERQLRERCDDWKALEIQQLIETPLSSKRINDLRESIQGHLVNSKRLANEIPGRSEVSPQADSTIPMLGMNLLIPKDFMVEEIFNNTYTDVEGLGFSIAQAHLKGEERKIIDILQKIPAHKYEASAKEIIEQISLLDGESENYVLIAPIGGFEDLECWYSTEFSHATQKIAVYESAYLDGQGFLFDKRTTINLVARPEEESRLQSIPDTPIALGVFDDVADGDMSEGEGPKVRVETGEYFVVWPEANAEIIQFGE